VSLLVVAPSRERVVMIGESHGTEALTRALIPTDERKTYVVHSRVAIGLTCGVDFDFGAVAALVDAALSTYRGGWNDEVLAFLDHELARWMSALVSRDDLQAAVGLADCENIALSIVALVASDDGPVVARYCVRPTLAIERDFERKLVPHDPALVVMVGMTQYVVAHALPPFIDDVLHFESRRIADVSIDEALAMGRRIHAAAEMTNLPLDVVHERFAHIERPVSWIGGRHTCVFVGYAGAKDMTDDTTTRDEEEVTMAGSTLLTAAASAAGMMAKPSTAPITVDSNKIQSK
jgi:hypothetical protein